MAEKGQMLALAVFLLAISLLAALATFREYTPEPQVVIVRDWSQAASVVTLGRLWVSVASRLGYFCPKCIRYTSQELWRLNRTYRLSIPPLTNTTMLRGEGDERAGYVNYYVYFYREDRGTEYVNVTVRVSYRFQGTYLKKVGKEDVLYKKYELVYTHEYKGPWGSLRVCPRLLDPDKEADIVEVGECVWMVGFPAKLGNYTLIDEFGIQVGVGWAWKYNP